MSTTNFQAANMAQALGGQKVTGNQECDNCHNNGGEDYYASRQGDNFFVAISTDRNHLQKHFMVAGADTATPTMEVNMPLWRMVLNREGIYAEHPTIQNGNGTVDDNPGINSVKAFFEATKAAMLAAPNGECAGGSKLDPL
jgi:hypothetical protein